MQKSRKYDIYGERFYENVVFHAVKEKQWKGKYGNEFSISISQASYTQKESQIKNGFCLPAKMSF